MQTFCTEDGAVLLAEAGGPSTGRVEPPPTQIYTPPPSTGSAYAPPSQPGYGPGGWQDTPATPSYAPPAVRPNYAPPMAPSMQGGQDQTLAIASLICGVLSIVLFCFSGILGIPAIVLGVMARKRVAENPERYGGAGLAMAGIVCGLAGTVFMVSYWLLAILGAALGN
jgi:serine/threonine-protein kinase